MQDFAIWGQSTKLCKRGRCTFFSNTSGIRPSDWLISEREWYFSGNRVIWLVQSGTGTVSLPWTANIRCPYLEYLKKRRKREKKEEKRRKGGGKGGSSFKIYLFDNIDRTRQGLKWNRLSIWKNPLNETYFFSNTHFYLVENDAEIKLFSIMTAYPDF